MFELFHNMRALSIIKFEATIAKATICHMVAALKVSTSGLCFGREVGTKCSPKRNAHEFRGTENSHVKCAVAVANGKQHSVPSSI